MEGAAEHLGLQPAECMALAALQVVKDDLRRAEEHRINLVEIAAVALENGGKGRPMIGRGRRRHLRADLGKLVVRCPNPDGDAAAVQDRVVGSPNRLQIVRGDRRQRRGAKAGNDLRQVKLQFIEFVQRCLHRTGHDLDTPGQTGRGCGQQGQFGRFKLQLFAEKIHHRVVGQLARLQDADGHRRPLASRDAVKELFLAIGRPHGPRAHGEELADRHLPACILGRHARQGRLVRRNRNLHGGHTGHIARN